MKKLNLLATIVVAILISNVSWGQTNTYYGTFAGQNGDYNSNFGYLSGNSQTGEYNTNVGHNAGQSNLGDHNTNLGAKAGCLITSGEANTFVGSWNSNAVTTGSFNTSVGFYGSSSLTTGSRNTLIGARSGYNLGAGDDDNVFIGYQAGYSETGSDKLYIANSSTNTLIYGDFSTGVVGIGTTSPASTLSIGGSGSADYKSYIYNSSTSGGKYGLMVKQEAATSSGSSTGSYGSVVIPSTLTYAGYYRGIYGHASRTSNVNSGRAYGVYGRAGNCTNGYNYGVFGNLEGDNEGAGVYGSVNDYNGYSTGGTYAGYFRGDVYVTGTMSAGTVVDRSDERLKDKIQPINEPSDKLFQLEGIKYVLIPKPNESDTSQTSVEDNSMGYFKDKLQYGFSAQKVQKVYPDLVYEGSDGYLGINYKGFIPLIISKLKEQQSVIEDQEVQIEELQNALTNAGILLNETGTIKLQQNNPNPFNETTEIKYSLSDDIQSAEIMIFDMNGTNLKTYKVDISENGKLTINANELKPGMYIYSLIADGKEAGTKRMIITE